MSSLMRRPIGPGIFLPLVCSLLVWACAEPNDQAPGVDQAHAPRYILQHAAEADNDLKSCKSCHGSDLGGGTNTRSCFACHENSLPVRIHPLPYSDPDAHGAMGRVEQYRCFACHGSVPNLFDGGILSDPDLFNAPDANCSAADCHPNAGAHPTRWQGDNDITGDYAASHRVVTTKVIRESCALCHQVAAQGRQPLQAAPSCFSASFRNSDSTEAVGCHSDGPGPSHDLPYDEPQQHGVPAKTDLSICQACHGTPGSIKFDGGTSDTACSSNDCHPDAGAHPTNWQGENDTGGYESTHRNAPWSEQTCGICHNVSSSGSGPNPAAPSCFVPSFENSNNNGAISCHSGGPGVSHDLPYDTPELHGDPAKSDMNNCQVCHGTPGTIKFDGGTSDTACSSNDCHPDAGAHPTNWQGENDTGGYESTHRNAPWSEQTCGICHNVSSSGSGPNPTAPSCFVPSFENSNNNGAISCHSGGPGIGHDLPYDTPQLHGDPAKNDISDCQACHGTPGTTSYDGGSSGVGCSSTNCHPDAGAHPTNWHGENDSGGYQSTHRDADWSEATCGVCHNVNSNNSGPNPAAPSCFVPNFENSNNSGAIGCHDGGPGFSHAHPYDSPAQHGGEAKSSLKDCQFCHGTQGTTSFDGGTTNTACSSNDCHPGAGAHPTNWQGDNDDAGGYQSTHRNAPSSIETCGICHDVIQGRQKPNAAAPSCFVGSYRNSTGTQIYDCHNSGPGVGHALPYDTPQLHGDEAKTNVVDCQACHGTPGTTSYDGGSSGVGCSSTNCHPDASAHPTNWHGHNDSGSYQSTHRDATWSEATCGVCHNVNSNNSGPNPAAPSCFVPNFENSNNNGAIGCHGGGPGLSHDHPYNSAALHGREAKRDMRDCQFCHGTQGSSSFDGGTTNTACSSNDCHPNASAHPTTWRGGTYSHRNANWNNSTCGICHRVYSSGSGPHPNAPSCFIDRYQNSEVSQSYSCHSNGPD